MRTELSPTSSLEVLSQPRRAILEYIKLEGKARAEEIADHLGVTVSGIRQHLAALQAEGLVDHEARRGQPGRPRFYFSLAAAGENLFPKAYSSFANEALLFLEEEDPALLRKLLALRVERRVMRLRPRLANLSLPEQVAELADSLTREGYMADSEPGEGDSVLLHERNCAVLDLSRIHPQICENECDMLKAALPGNGIVREQHILDGAPHCTYRITPGTSAK